MLLKRAHFFAIVFLIVSCTGDFNLQTGTMILSLDGKGNVVKLADRKTGKDYLYKEKEAPLLSIRTGGLIEFPSKLDKTSDSTFNLLFGKSDITVNIKFKIHKEYLSLEATGIDPDTAVDLLIWGPYPTIIGKTIGETAGVVRDDKYAIGIQALNIKTLGGYPTHEDDEEPAYDIFATGDLTDISDSIKIVYRGQTARPESFGSVLQAYCRDRHSARIIPVWGYKKYYVPAFEDGGIKGTKIALFGCSPGNALETIGTIEKEEGLPHPMLEGKWGKISPEATSSYLIMNFGIDNIDDAIALTKRAGLKYLYHGGPFEDWGHFKLNEKEFPDNWASLKKCVEKAESAGLHVGVHTLSNFITTNDPYVSSVPDPRLAKVGSTVLSQDIDKTSGTIAIDDPSFFNSIQNSTLHACVIGNEIIQYDSITAEKHWKLTGCRRGAFGTVISDHHKGDTISQLTDHPYKTFLGNMQLSEEMATRIADLFNDTGLKQISFDGLEGNWASGLGQYGRQLFVKTWYDHLIPELKGKVINDASNPGHFFWHIYTRMNWGEPWYAGFRESQTQLRLRNQDYFRRNLMPSMLGWFSMRPGTSLEDIEWLLARAAGFNAGFALVTSPETVRKNGLGEKILETIKTWETARHENAFSDEQMEGLRDIKNEYSLEPASDNQLKLFQYHVQRYKLPGGDDILKQGDAMTLKISNPYDRQSLNFIVTAVDASYTGPVMLSIDNHEKILIGNLQRPGWILKYSGGLDIILYDADWHAVKSIPVRGESLNISEGDHSISFYSKGSENDSSQFTIELRTRNNGELIHATR